MKCDFCRQREALLIISTASRREAHICLTAECADKVADYIGTKDTIRSYTTIKGNLHVEKPAQRMPQEGSSKDQHPHVSSKKVAASVQGTQRGTKTIRIRPKVMPDVSKFPAVGGAR